MQKPGQSFDLVLGYLAALEVLTAEVVLSLDDACLGCHLEVLAGQRQLPLVGVSQ